MKEGSMKPLTMLAIGALMSPFSNAFAEGPSQKDDASVVIQNLIQSKQIQRDEKGKLVITPDGLKALRDSDLVSDEELLKQLEQKLQVEPNLQQSFVVAIL